MLGLAKGPTEVFDPLKAVLESVSVVYAKHEVRFGAPVRGPSLTVTYTGRYYFRGQE